MARGFRAVLTAALSTALVAAAAFVTPMPAHALPMPTSGGTLNWGVSDQWGEYVTGPIAVGSITAGAPATAAEDNTVRWVNGQGEVDLTAGTGAVTYEGSMTSQGHVGLGATGGFGLDQTLANPQIVFTSPTSATLSAEVTQGAYNAWTAHSGERVVLADLTMAPRDLADGQVTATGVFSATSAPVFGNYGNFKVGMPTGQVVFTVPVETPAEATTTALQASRYVVREGEPVDLTTTVTPETAAGTVTFTSNGKELLGGPTPVLEGTASLSGVRLPAGENSIIAYFEPEEPGSFTASQSAVASVQVQSNAVATGVTMTSHPSGKLQEGQTVTITAKVAPAEAQGTVQFFDADATIGAPIPVSNGTAEWITRELAVGTYSLSARFVPSDSTAWEASTTASTTKLVVSPRDSGEEIQVSSGQLTWSVKDTWWNYVYGPIAVGEVRAGLPATLVREKNASGESVPIAVTWNDASSRGPVNLVAGRGTIGYKGEMISLGHAGPGYPGGFGLNQSLRDPQIELTSPTTGRLSATVTQTGYANFPSVRGERVVIADLKFTAKALKSGKVTTTSAVFTAAGAKLYGNYGNHTTGSYVAPVSFSVNAAAVKPTTTTLTASARSVTTGDGVKLTAQIAPSDAAGKVSFFQGDTKVAERVVVNGKAEHAVRALNSVGDQVFRAEFLPSNRAYANSVGSSTVTVVAMPPMPPTVSGSSQEAGALVWGVSSAFAAYTTGPIAKGSLYSSGVGSTGGAYIFPQAAGGSWDAATQTGTVQYSGEITFTGHGGLLKESFSNPLIQVTSQSAGTVTAGGRSFGLNLAGAEKSVGAGGSVTWSGVPVSGEICGGGASGGGSGGGCFNADRLSFTVGSVSKVAYGSTVAGKDAKEKRVAADTPPTTEGLTVVTDAKKLVPGARIEIQAAGFEPGDEGVLVVLYSDPIVLDETATADEFGIVKWKGKLPDDIALGEHVLTLQGSTDAGAKITILPKAEKKAKATAVEAESQPLAAAPGAGTPVAVARSGMALWEWWTIALSLVMIAGCTTILAVRQRAQ